MLTTHTFNSKTPLFLLGGVTELSADTLEMETVATATYSFVPIQYESDCIRFWPRQMKRGKAYLFYIGSGRGIAIRTGEESVDLYTFPD